MREAEEAAKLFVERRYERVRHEVTSVRRDWGSVLSETWDELGPWRAQAAEWSRKGLAVSLRYSIIAGRAAARFAVAAARLIWAGLVGAWRVVLAFLIGAVRLLDAAGRGGVRSILAGTAVVARGAGSVLLGLLKLPRALFGLAVRGSRSLLLGLLKLLRLPRALFGLVARGGRKTGHSLAASGRRAGAAGRGIVQASSRTASAGGRAVQAGLGRVRVASVPRLKARLPQAARIGEKVKRGRLRALLGRPAGVLPYARRYWYAPVGVGLVSLAFVFGPGFVGMVGGLREELPARLPEVAPPQLPRVTLPKVTLPKLTVPKVTIRTPAFIETSVSKIGELISRPLLNEPGRWIVVADIEEDVMEPLDVAEGPLEPVEVGEEAPEPVRLVRAARLATPAALTVALEADLAQSRFFSVVPRERALTAEANATGRPANRLRGSDALALAQAHGWTLVVAGKLSRGSEVDTLRLQVFGPRGDTLYGVAAELPVGSERLATLADLSRAVRRRLGEPEEDVATSAPPTALLSTSEPALNAYARARLHVVRGHYFEAINAAREATGHDATFAKAFHLLADAYAQRGQRIQGRNALESAWVYSERVGERERLRITADRLAWDGRYAKAVLAYDELFQQFRDDAGALRSLAILQRVLGARGGGLGNLAVSYEMDPHDWPSLSHLARYLGYRGRLPDVDSLQAALRQPPAANPALEPAPLNE